MRNKVTDMTVGNPIKLLITFAIPMMIGNVFQQLYNLVDSIIVGKLVGTDALAAIGVTGSVTFLFFALCNGIGSGGGIVTSQYFGSGDTSLGFVICGIIKRKYRVKKQVSADAGL